MMDNFSVRLRVALLLASALIPALIFIGGGVYYRYSDASGNAIKELSNSSRNFSKEQAQNIEGARQLLVAVSQTPQITMFDKRMCGNYLATLLNNFSRYANFGVAATNGDVICSAVPIDLPVNVKDKLYFKKVLNSKTFSVGEYSIGNITGKPVLNFGYPILNSNGALIGVVFSSLDLGWMNDFLSASLEGEDTVLMVLDHEGTIMARNIDPGLWIGKSFAKDPLFQKILQKGGGATDLVGIDGIKRLYAFQKLGESDSAYVVVGKTQNEVFKGAISSLKTSLLVVLLMGIMIAVVSYRVGNIFIIKKIEDLQEIDRLKSEFVSIASHQLRTPLSAINWFLELLDDEKNKLTTYQKKIVRNIKESNGRMIDLVESLLNVSRIESKKLKVERAEVEVDKEVKKVVDAVSPKAIMKKQRFVFKPNSARLLIDVDPKLFFQIVNNIVTNAIKYTPPKGKIIVNVSSKNSRAVVKVADSGYGISKQDKGKIFQKFFRGANISGRDIEGTGLGLFIAKSIAEEMGGKVTFTSTEGKGSTFYISFPAQS